MAGLQSDRENRSKILEEGVQFREVGDVVKLQLTYGE